MPCVCTSKKPLYTYRPSKILNFHGYVTFVLSIERPVRIFENKWYLSFHQKCNISTHKWNKSVETRISWIYDFFFFLKNRTGRSIWHVIVAHPWKFRKLIGFSTGGHIFPLAFIFWPFIGASKLLFYCIFRLFYDRQWKNVTASGKTN